LKDGKEVNAVMLVGRLFHAIALDPCVYLFEIRDIKKHLC